MGRMPCQSNFTPADEQDETVSKMKWFDSLPIHEQADLMRGYIETNHAVQDAFLHGIDQAFQMARKFAREE